MRRDCVLRFFLDFATKNAKTTKKDNKEYKTEKSEFHRLICSEQIKKWSLRSMWQKNNSISLNRSISLFIAESIKTSA